MAEITRRTFAALPVAAAGQTSVSGALPNIVFLIPNDYNAPALGCYGNQAIHTPNLDALAKDWHTSTARSISPNRFRLARRCMRATLWTLLAALALAGADDGFVSLMPKKDVTEFWIVEVAPPETWRVENNTIICAGKPNGFLRSKKSYKNYILRAEWRFKKEGWVPRPEDEGWPNAGFFISAGPIVKGWPTSLEVQGHFGEAGSVFGVRGGKVTGAKRGPIVKNRIPFGEWDKYEITAKDGKVRVILNGELVNESRDIYPAEGNICLQSEGWEVHYRNIEIKELP